jgi:hypothetical protein
VYSTISSIYSRSQFLCGPRLKWRARPGFDELFGLVARPFGDLARVRAHHYSHPCNPKPSSKISPSRRVGFIGCGGFLDIPMYKLLTSFFGRNRLPIMNPPHRPSMQPTLCQPSERYIQQHKQALTQPVPEGISLLILDFAGCWQPTVFARRRQRSQSDTGE